MIWYCRYTWYPGTTNEKVRERVVMQHDAGTNQPSMIKGWYNLAGGGAGFLLIDTEDPRQLNQVLEPYMDLMAWDVHGVYQLEYNQAIQEFKEMQLPQQQERQMSQSAGRSTGV